MDDVGWWIAMFGCVSCVCKRERLEVGVEYFLYEKALELIQKIKTQAPFL